MFAKFNRILLTIREKNAPTETKLHSIIKKTTSEKSLGDKKKFNIQLLRNIVTSMTTILQKCESFVSFKNYRNLVNRKLKEAQNQFSVDFFKEKWILKSEMEIH